MGVALRDIILGGLWLARDEGTGAAGRDRDRVGEHRAASAHDLARREFAGGALGSSPGRGGGFHSLPCPAPYIHLPVSRDRPLDDRRRPPGFLAPNLAVGP